MIHFKVSLKFKLKKLITTYTIIETNHSNFVMLKGILSFFKKNQISLPNETKPTKNYFLVYESHLAAILMSTIWIKIGFFSQRNLKPAVELYG